MGLLAQILGVAPEVPRNPDDEHWWGAAPVQTSAGINVTPEVAMMSSAVYACVALIAETLASLPLITYRRLPNGDRERATQNPLYDLLHDQPNHYQTAFEFKEMMQGHAMMRGDAFAQKVPGPRGPVDQLIPLHPDRVTVERLNSRAIRYRVRNELGTETVFLQDEIFHLRGKGSDGLRGESVVGYARNSIGLALATEEHGGLFFKNGTNLSGILTTEQKLDAKVKARVGADWARLHSGRKNAHTAAVLEQGLKWQEMGMTNTDAQFLESRVFQLTDIARWFRVPPHMIGETTKATSWGTGIEQLSIAFVMYTLLPWMTRWQQAINRDLILARGQYFSEFLIDALLRGDITARYNAYNIGRNGGWLSVNDIRKMENQNSIPGGDIYLQPLNMTDAGAKSLPSTPEQDDEEATAYHRLMVREAAARVVRKEIAALNKFADRGADPSEIAAFYEKHADFVSEVLHLHREDGRQYADYQREMIKGFGMGSITNDETTSIEMLLAYVEHRHG